MAYESHMTSTPDPRPAPSTIEGHVISHQADGSIVVEGPGIAGGRIPKRGEFDENLAEQMDQGDRRLLAMRLCEFASVDKESRKDWEKREKTALLMLGVTREQAEEPSTTSGHDVVHPVLIDATVRFQANAITELFPPTGPAETKVVGKSTPQKLACAHRIRTFLNHYLVDIDPGYFNDTDKMLMYLPMGGSVFRKGSQDYTTGLPVLRHVKGTNFIAPYAGTDLESMPRYAHEFTMTGEDVDKAMQIGIFADVYLQQPSLDRAKHPIAADQSDYREPVLHDRDRLYAMYEYHVDLQLDCDAQGAGNEHLDDLDTGSRPYIVVVDIENSEIVMCRRNWRERDNKHKKRIRFTHHQFLPGLGFYGWGYPHVIGSLGLSASGAVNALLDGALAANFQGGFFTKEGRVAGELRLEHGVWKSIDSTAEDLAKSFFTPPFKEPSPALFQLLGLLVEAGQRFAGTTDAAVGDGNNTGPVGTTIALIEQAAKPQTAIHKRLHVSMGQELKMLCELIEDFMPPQYDYQLGGSQETLLKSDFGPGVEVIPVTDPNVSSDTQRIMRAQAVLDMQTQSPDLYKPPQRIEAQRRMLIALKIPNIDAIAPKADQPQYLDAISENALMFKGQGVRAFPTQNHMAHIQIHEDGLARAQGMFPQEVLKNLNPHMQAHIQDHYAAMYTIQMMQSIGMQPNFDADGNPQALDPRMAAQLDQRMAQVVKQLPHPEPKPKTPSGEQAAAAADLQNKQATAQAEIKILDDKADAEEQRKQKAFDNEERRKDQALANQEARLDSVGATKMIRDAHGNMVKVAASTAATDQKLAQGDATHAQALVHTDDKHVQQLQQGAEVHQQQQAQGAAAHDQTLTQGEDSHQQTLEQGDASHQQGMDHADQVARAAAAEEAQADAHVKP